MKELAKQCIEHVGGAANIQAVSHCATRLRLTLRDQSQVNEAALTALPEVIKVMQVGVQTQIIIGSDAPELYGVVSQLVEQAQSEAPAKSAEAAEKQPAVKNKKKAAAGKFFDACSSMFTPLVPAFTAAGMIKAVLAILVAVFGLAKTSQEYIIINYVSDTIFYFLPIYLGVTAASYFGCNKYIAAAVTAMFVHPTYVGLVSAGEAVAFFGIPVVLYNYSSTVFPTILTVWFMSYVERFARKVSPKVVKAIMEPADLLSGGTVNPRPDRCGSRRGLNADLCGDRRLCSILSSDDRRRRFAISGLCRHAPGSRYAGNDADRPDGFQLVVRHRYARKQHRAGSFHTGPVIEVEG